MLRPFRPEQTGITYAVAALIMCLVFNIFPVKRLWGIKRDEALEEGGTKDVSYLANMGWSKEEERGPVGPASPIIQHVDSDGGTGPAEVYTATEAAALAEHSAEKRRERAIQCKLLRVAPEELDRGRLQMYYPPIPAAASDQTVNNIVDEYRLFAAAVPGDPTLLPGQKEQTGGASRVCPPASRSMAAMALIRCSSGTAGYSARTTAAAAEILNAEVAEVVYTDSGGETCERVPVHYEQLI